MRNRNSITKKLESPSLKLKKAVMNFSEAMEKVVEDMKTIPEPVAKVIDDIEYAVEKKTKTEVAFSVKKAESRIVNFCLRRKNSITKKALIAFSELKKLLSEDVKAKNFSEEECCDALCEKAIQLAEEQGVDLEDEEEALEFICDNARKVARLALMTGGFSTKTPRKTRNFSLSFVFVILKEAKKMAKEKGVEVSDPAVFCDFVSDNKEEIRRRIQKEQTFSKRIAKKAPRKTDNFSATFTFFFLEEAKKLAKEKGVNVDKDEDLDDFLRAHFDEIGKRITKEKNFSDDEAFEKVSGLDEELEDQNKQIEELLEGVIGLENAINNPITKSFSAITRRAVKSIKCFSEEAIEEKLELLSELVEIFEELIEEKTNEMETEDAEVVTEAGDFEGDFEEVTDDVEDMEEVADDVEDMEEVADAMEDMEEVADDMEDMEEVADDMEDEDEDEDEYNFGGVLKMSDFSEEDWAAMSDEDESEELDFDFEDGEEEVDFPSYDEDIEDEETDLELELATFSKKTTSKKDFGSIIDALSQL